MSEPFDWRRARAIAEKETFHIMRDPFTLTMALGMPILMVVIYGLAMDFNVKNVYLSVSDRDQTQSSRRMVDTFASSGYFVVESTDSPSQVFKNVESEVAKAGLIIPPRFEKDLLAGRNAKAQILLDGADNSTVGPVAGYVGTIQELASRRLVDFDPTSPYEIRTRFLFNSELNSRWFVVPGLTVVVMAILSILLTSLTVAREWENGSMELLLSTPVQPIEIIVGKLTPYGVMGLVAVAMVFVIARVFFGVPFAGNPILFAIGSVLFLVTYLAQGLLISVLARNQMVAVQFAMLTGYLPSQLLSGFVFPVASMPVFFHYFTMIFPARWFMEICRDSFLKEPTFGGLAVPFFAISLICFFMVRLARAKFKGDLEK